MEWDEDDGDALPVAWQAAMRFCPFCSGTGQRAGRDCIQCEGTGNLFRTYIRAAYRLGQEDGLHRLRGLREHAEKALQATQEDKGSEASMLLRLGL